MDTDKIRKALDARIAEIAELGDAIERTTAASELLAVLDKARADLAQACSR